MSDSLPLPEYVSPPITEVAFGIQFEPLEDVLAVHLALLWQEFRKDYPRVQEHPPLDPAFERFDQKAGSKGPSVQLIGAMPVPRFWFLTEDEAQLIQVQQDRLVFNWRKREGTAEYPRYEHVRSEFREGLNTLEEFLRREDLGTLTPNQCELTYVNLIEPGAEWERHGQIGEVIPTVKARFSDQFLQEAESLNFNMTFRIPGKDGPIGRLHIQGGAGFLKEGLKPVIRLRLVARGAPEDPSLKSSFDFLDLAHEWIVRGFTSITSPQMHRIWERSDA